MRGPGENGGENQIGSRPSGALWWAALTARRETGGATGHIDYTSLHADTGKLSNDSFTYGGVTRAIDGLFVDRNGHFQIWVDSGNGSVLPNGSVLHVGSESLTLGSATPVPDLGADSGNGSVRRTAPCCG